MSSVKKPYEMSLSYKYSKAGFVNKLKEHVKTLKHRRELYALDDESGYSPLMIATMNHRENVVYYLIDLPEVKSHINEKSAKEEMTALMFAAYVDNFPITDMILHANPNKNLRNKEGKTALDIAVETKHVGIAYMLENMKDIVKQHLKESEMEISKNDEAVINQMKTYAYEFINGDHRAIGKANITFSYFMMSIIKNMDVYDDMIYPDVKVRLIEFTERSLNQNISLFVRRLNRLKLSTITDFKKDVQWPHIPFLYLDKRRGSCVDLLIVKLMLYEQKQMKYNFGMFSGSNTLLSHTEIFSIEDTSKLQNKLIVFTLFSMYHVFRVLQIIRYITKREIDAKRIVAVMKKIIYSIWNNKYITKSILEFLISRQNEAYKCMRIIKTAKYSPNPKKVQIYKHDEIPFTTKKKVIASIKEQFPNRIGKRNPNYINWFIFRRPIAKNNVMVYHDAGYVIFRMIHKNETQLLKSTYGKNITHGIYISFIMKIKTDYPLFLASITQELNHRFPKKSLYIEVFKNNNRAIKAYKNTLYKIISETPTKALMVREF